MISLQMFYPCDISVISPPNGMIWFNGTFITPSVPSLISGSNATTLAIGPNGQFLPSGSLVLQVGHVINYGQMIFPTSTGILPPDVLTLSNQANGQILIQGEAVFGDGYTSDCTTTTDIYNQSDSCSPVIINNSGFIDISEFGSLQLLGLSGINQIDTSSSSSYVILRVASTGPTTWIWGQLRTTTLSGFGEDQIKVNIFGTGGAYNITDIIVTDRTSFTHSQWQQIVQVQSFGIDSDILESSTFSGQGIQLGWTLTPCKTTVLSSLLLPPFDLD
jgi:hypothetical protein